MTRSTYCTSYTHFYSNDSTRFGTTWDQPIFVWPTEASSQCGVVPVAKPGLETPVADYTTDCLSRDIPQLALVYPDYSSLGPRI